MRFGLVGTGWWALGTPGPALAAHPDVELAGVWGRDPAKTSGVAEQLTCRSYEAFDALLDDVDAVAFAVPPDIQLPLALRAAERGRHLILEKPLAFSPDHADRLVHAIDAARIAALVFHTDTYRPELDESRRYVAAHTWFGARATIFVSVLEPGGVLLDSAWRVERGALWDAGPHAVSPLIDSLGPVTDVVAMRGARHTVQATLRHGDTATSTVVTTLHAPTAAQAWGLSWYGTQGWHHRPDTTTPSLDAYRAAITDLRHAATNAAPARSTVSHARDVVATLHTIDTALSRGSRDCLNNGGSGSWSTRRA